MDSATAQLINHLKAGDILERSRAAQSLGLANSPEVVPYLEESLGDKAHVVRWEAAKALGVLSFPVAIQSLVKVLGDQHPGVRKQALNALIKLGWEPSSARQKAEYVFAAGLDWKHPLMVEDVRTEAVRLVLQFPDSQLRLAAGKTLAMLGDPRAIELLASAGEELNDQELGAVIREIFQGPFTEREWLSPFAQPSKMLQYAEASAAPRKLLLFATGSLRLCYSQLDDLERRFLTVVEEMAEGTVNRQDVQATQEKLRERAALQQTDWSKPWSKAADLCSALADALQEDCPSRMAQVALEMFCDRKRSAGFARVIASDLVREVFGNPFRPVVVEPAWLSRTVIEVAREGRQEPTRNHLTILADALEDSGCDDSQVLEHCRRSGPHVPGCWVLDLVLDSAAKKSR